MKKFYTLAIAALVAVSSVSAAGLDIWRFNADNNLSFKKIEKTSISTNMPESDKVLNSASAKDIDITDISGQYNWQYTSMFKDDNGATITNKITVTKGVGNNYTIQYGSQYGSFSFGATFSMISQTLSINANQVIGTHSQLGDVYLYHKQVVNNDLTNSSAPLTATINGDSFEFGAEEIIAIGNDAVGYIDLGYKNVFNVYTPVEWDNYQILPEDGWVEAGTAQFADAWMLPAANVDPAQYAYEVAVEKNENIEGMYRLVNPYLNSPMSNNDAKAEGFIAFSIADPEFVPVVPLSYCGFTAALSGGTTASLLPTNLEGYFLYLGDNYTKEDIIAGLSTEDEPFVPSSFDDATGTVTLKNCRWATTNEPTKNYVWSVSATESAVQEGWIKFDNWAGINGVTAVDNENAPVEYYNLQGMRINNVENNPGLYIRKQGDKATKVYVK